MFALILALMLPPCDIEDGSSQAACYWDASSAGNGVGVDVVNLNYGATSFTLDSH